MKLLTLFIMTIFLTSTAYGVRCIYPPSSAKETKAVCKMTVKGELFQAEGVGRSINRSMARTMACAECRTNLIGKMPDKLKKEFANPDGSITLGVNGPIAPKKIPDGDETFSPKQPQHTQISRVGEQDERSLSCMKVSKYAYCSDGNFYEPVSPEKNSKLQKVVARILNQGRNQVKKIPAQEDDGEFRGQFSH
jgi:hypothetical protein